MAATTIKGQFPYEMDRFMAPISEESPSGDPLAYEGTYDKIREARREDDPTLDRGVWTASLKRADWGEVERICVDALENSSKDLQIGAWLLEAWLHLHGFAGVREGVRLQSALCEFFWDDLHPRMDGDDLEPRVGPLIWMNEKLSVDLKLIPITKPQPEDLPAYAWTDWETSSRLQPGTQAWESRSVDAVTESKFHQSATLTSTAFLSQLVRDTEAIMDACTEMESTLEQKCGSQAPSLRQLWNVLEPIHALLVSTLGQRETAPVDGNAAALASDEALEIGDGGVPVSADGRIRSRADAYRRLSEVADYLARIEPHSPTPYLVRRAVFWGSMKFDELLPELVRDEGEVTEIFRLLQIRQREE